MDYEHALEFGAFLTPDAAHLDRLLENAQLADVAGLDLVCLQDHPYAAQQGDMWTLLSVIAARTTAVRLAPNVASLPLRPPVVLAKAAATLDLVTGGRVELGLGAGAFWDGIVAAGGPRRTPREAVDALIEAIRIIRAFWAGGSVRIAGEHYSAVGLKPGPVPAHDIPLWLGAYKPRMLRVTAQLADVWIPSMGYADPPALPDMNAAIDEAAVAAGRSPEAVRRAYNIFGSFGRGSEFLKGTPANWAAQLAELALAQGISTFILGSDDPRALATFAQEVAPAVRDQVDTERERRATQGLATQDERPVGDDESGRNFVGGPGYSAARQRKGGPTREQSGLAGAEAGQADEESGMAGGRTQQTGLSVRATPDDGTRLAREEAWDEGDRPSYVLNERDFTAEQEATAQHLVDVHDHLRQELQQVRGIIAQVRDGSLGVGAARSAINTMTMRQNNWTLGAYCAAYCRVVTGHHTLEDRSVFPHLRRADPALAPVIDRLEHEHDVIADLLDRLDEALVAVVSTDAAAPALDTLAAEVDLLTDALLSHLAYEERELLAPLAAYGFQ